MPKGNPSTETLSASLIRAFSLDTSVVEAASFRFDQGAMRSLSSQLPPWMELWMSTIVVQEISSHRMASVKRSLQEVETGIAGLRRHIGAEFNPGSVVWMNGVCDIAREEFDRQFQRFLKTHNGRVLTLDQPGLAEKIFQYYFSVSPPFGAGKDRKNEFPDAAILLVLEKQAEEHNCQVIVVSKDAGWKAFADKSERIYCIDSLEVLASLYESSSEDARSLRNRVMAILENPSFEVRRKINEAVKAWANTLPFLLEVPYQHFVEIDAGVVESKILETSAIPEVVGVWIPSAGQKTAVVEIGVTYVAELTIEAYAYRRIYAGAKEDMANTFLSVQHEGEIRLIMSLNGELINVAPWASISDVDVRADHEVIKLREIDFGGEVGLVPRKRGFFDEFDEDVPF